MSDSAEETAFTVWRAFWLPDHQYNTLREAFRKLYDAKLGVHWYSTRIAEIAGTLHAKRSDRHVRRFLSEDPTAGTPFRNKHIWLNALLVLCAEQCQSLTHGERLSEPFADLLRLSADHASAVAASYARSHPVSRISRDDRVYTRDELLLISSSITSTAFDDPNQPEFPLLAPRFPATATHLLELESGRRIKVKDEGQNPTGSHKDRWAWEQIVQYRNTVIQTALSGSQPHIRLRPLSLISSGSAALALQHQLRVLGLPDLRVVYDAERMSLSIVERLRSIGCRLFPADLDHALLTAADVLEITGNHEGIDVTSRDPLDPHRYRYYDWLVMEILQERPRHIFVPFGTGDLYIGIISEIVAERRRTTPDPRLRGCKVNLDDINVYGGTTFARRTYMDKLYAPFRPNYNAIKAYVAENIRIGNIGNNSGIFEVADDDAVWAEALATKAGISTEPSGIAGLALLRKHLEHIPEADTILVINTGRFHSRSASVADQSTKLNYCGTETSAREMPGH